MERRPARSSSATATAFPPAPTARCSRVWRAAGWRVEAIAKYGHDPALPGHQQLAAAARPADRLPRPAGHAGAAGAGRALDGRLPQPEGGAAPPGPGRAVLLLDSPVVGGWRAPERAAGQGDPADPARLAGAGSRRHGATTGPRSTRRARTTPTKHVFARWAPGVLDGLPRRGLLPAADRRRAAGLRPPRRGAHLRHAGTRPARAADAATRCAARSASSRAPVARGAPGRPGRHAGALVREQLQWIEGTHLFPMEKPAETAQRTLALLDTLTAPR